MGRESRLNTKLGNEMIGIEDITVVCDETACDWEKKVDAYEFPAWLNKPCPKCNKGTILTQTELDAFNEVSAMIDASMGVLSGLNMSIDMNDINASAEVDVHIKEDNASGSIAYSFTKPGEKKH